MLTAPGHDRGGQRDQHERPQEVRDEHQAQPVDAIGDRAGVQAAEQPGQLLQQHGHRDQDGRAGLGCHQQRAGR
jgi:hypothetical protein